MAVAAPRVGTATTVVFGTSGFEMNKVTVSLSPTRESTPAPTLGATGFVAKVYGDLVDGEQMTLEGYLDPSKTIPLDGPSEDITITWPDTTAQVVTGAWVADERSAEAEVPMPQTITIEVENITGYLTP